MNILKCPNCALLISNAAIKQQNKAMAWRRPWFNRPIKCNHCDASLKMRLSTILLGIVFFVLGAYGMFAGESLAISLLVIGTIGILWVTFRLGISHKILDDHNT